MPVDLQTYYERRLMTAIEAIDAHIKQLHEEKNALKRQLVEARWERHALKDVSRKNSGTRVMVEARVLGALQATSKPIATRDLYSEGLKANFEMKEPTFRTYLHRMKEKGLIQSPSWGRWTLPKTVEAKDTTA